MPLYSDLFESNNAQLINQWEIRLATTINELVQRTVAAVKATIRIVDNFDISKQR